MLIPEHLLKHYEQIDALLIDIEPQLFRYYFKSHKAFDIKMWLRKIRLEDDKETKQKEIK